MSDEDEKPDTLESKIQQAVNRNQIPDSLKEFPPIEPIETFDKQMDAVRVDSNPVHRRHSNVASREENGPYAQWGRKNQHGCVSRFTQLYKLQG